jgi:ribosome-associated protein
VHPFGRRRAIEPFDLEDRRAAPPRRGGVAGRELLRLVEHVLDEHKAEEVVVIELAGKSTIADYMVVASGGSQRHVAALAEHAREAVKAACGITPPVEGLAHADWVLIDGGDVIVHLFRPEVRAFYNIEKMWGVDLPERSAAL